MNSALTSVCVWIPYVLNSALPKNATLGGVFDDGDATASHHAYVARVSFDGETIPVRQTHTLHHWGISFRRGTNDYVRAVQLGDEEGEILTCQNKLAKLRWRKFQPKMDMESCIPYGLTNTGETGYVGRTFARHPKFKSIYGLLPGFFVPSEGSITVYLGSIIHSTAVEVLCVKSYGEAER